MFPHLGPEFVAALTEQHDKKKRGTGRQKAPKSTPALNARDSVLGFCKRQIQVLKSIRISVRFRFRGRVRSSPLKSFL